MLYWIVLISHKLLGGWLLHRGIKSVQGILLSTTWNNWAVIMMQPTGEYVKTTKTCHKHSLSDPFIKPNWIFHHILYMNDIASYSMCITDLLLHHHNHILGCIQHVPSNHAFIKNQTSITVCLTAALTNFNEVPLVGQKRSTIIFWCTSQKYTLQTHDICIQTLHDCNKWTLSIMNIWTLCGPPACVYSAVLVPWTGRTLASHPGNQVSAVPGLSVAGSKERPNRRTLKLYAML